MSRPALASCAIILATAVAAQGAEFSPRLTEYGHPDFQGIWTNETQTPFLRPEELETKQSYSLAEANEVERGKTQMLEERAAPLGPARTAPELTGSIQNQSEDIFKRPFFNILVVDGEYRTSILVDPPNGRLPFKENCRAMDIYGQWRAAGHGSFDGPEIREPGERCLSDWGQLPPMRVVPVSSNFKFVQNQDYVVLYIEAGAEVRIIKLSDTHSTALHKKWRGDSIGYWDDNTLVVHTNNFHRQQSVIRVPSSELFEVDERFTLISDDEIFYRYTVTDPNIYTQSFTGELMLSRMPSGDKLYDYACHEGNYSLPGILAGARRQERDGLIR